ncbi:MAG: 2-oxo acid dehydrogenase subunit E2 [Roseococcus sp.]
MADLSWAALRVPRCVMAARLHLPGALAARAALPAPRPPWTAIFAKAFALTALERPALRQFHASLPWPRLLRLDHAIGCVMVERAHLGEPTLTLARFVQPHAMPLPLLGALLHEAKTAPPEATKCFRRMLRFASHPWPLRRLMMRVALAFATPLARYGGSFSVSSLGERGASILDSVSILPVFLSYGPIGPDGAVDVFIAFDHRVMDGADAAAALSGIAAMIEGPLVAELDALRAG